MAYSMQHTQDVLLFLVLVVNSDPFGVTPSHFSCPFLCALAAIYLTAYPCWSQTVSQIMSLMVRHSAIILENIFSAYVHIHVVRI